MVLDRFSEGRFDSLSPLAVEQYIEKKEKAIQQIAESETFLTCTISPEGKINTIGCLYSSIPVLKEAIYEFELVVQKHKELIEKMEGRKENDLRRNQNQICNS